MVNIIVQLIFFVYLLILYINNGIPNSMNNEFMLTIISIDLMALASFIFLRKENISSLHKQYVRVSYIFLLSFLIVHFQCYLDYLMGNLDEDSTFIWINVTVVSKALVICSMALISYMLGYSLFNKKDVTIKITKSHKIIKPKLLVFLAGILLVVFFASVNSQYLNGHYGSEDKGSLAGYSSFLFECVISALIIINSRNLLLQDKTKLTFIEYLKAIKYPAAMLAVYLCGVMISGDRGPIIYSSLGVLFGYIYITKRKIHATRILLFIFLGSLFITILGLARRADKNLDFSEKISTVMDDEIVTKYYPDSFSNNTKELASSIRTVHIAVSTVPMAYPHFKGLFALQDILLIIPSAKGLMISVLGLPKQFTSSAQFLTFIDLGAYATWGVGTSCVADTYLDFGFFGVIVVFFLFGMTLRKFEVIVFSKSIGSIAFIICVYLFFTYSIYLPRASILYGLSKFVYILIFIYLPILLTKKEIK